jgi:hypothetical protein
MATAQQLSSAINSQNVPIDVIPDYQVGGSGYGQELVNQQPAGTYKYGSGPSTYLSVAPGTKTLQSKQFDEDKRAQAAAEDLAERKFQEDVRAQRVAEALARFKASSSGGDDDLTQTERNNLNTATMFDIAVNRYSNNKGAGLKFPLYYTISSMLRDPDVLGNATEAGVNMKTVIDNLISSQGDMSPEEYFKTSTGSKLKALYEGKFGKFKTEKKSNSVSLDL